MNQFAKVLGNATVAVVATMNFEISEAVEVKQFNARVYETANMGEITRQDPFLTVGIKILQDSYRAHLDEVRNKEKTSDLLKDDNYKYFLTLYDVIPTEMAKAVFGIKVTDDSVNYVNKSADTVIECISGGGQYLQKYKRVYRC